MTLTTKRRRFRVDWSQLALYYLVLLAGILIGVGFAVKYGNAWPQWQ